MIITATNRPAFTRRTGDTFQNHRRRAKEDNQSIDYTLPQFREGIETALQDALCHYCEQRLTMETWSVDHMVPVSRGGAHAWNNLLVCCQTCNRTKGRLTHHEFCQLLALITRWPSEATSDILIRLRRGGVMRHK